MRPDAVTRAEIGRSELLDLQPTAARIPLKNIHRQLTQSDERIVAAHRDKATESVSRERVVRHELGFEGADAGRDRRGHDHEGSKQPDELLPGSRRCPHLS